MRYLSREEKAKTGKKEKKKKDRERRERKNPSLWHALIQEGTFPHIMMRFLQGTIAYDFPWEVAVLF